MPAQQSIICHAASFIDAATLDVIDATTMRHTSRYLLDAAAATRMLLLPAMPTQAPTRAVRHDATLGCF